MEELKLILEMGTNAGNAFYYLVAVQAFGKLIILLITLGGFYLIYKVALIIVSVANTIRGFKEISNIVDRTYTSEPYQSEINDVIERTRQLVKKEKDSK